MSHVLVGGGGEPLMQVIRKSTVDKGKAVRQILVIALSIDEFLEIWSSFSSFTSFSFLTPLTNR